ncbi:MAG: autotransporter domain-containing protein [Proteobacteria bacterium]|nr:autotransporter domain-containing protein [Pseudomonadota bacterium]
MIHYKKIAAAVALCCSASAWASSYNNVYVFGDSLSDAGAFTNFVAAIGRPTANRFTTNPGTIWAENIGISYGIAVTPGYALNPTTSVFSATGGNDYAIGGARVTLTPGVFSPSAAIAANIVPLTNQITTNLGQTGGVANPNALYLFWGGANDVFYQSGAVAVGLPVANAAAAVGTAAADAVTQIKRLQTSGARNLVVLALPDMGINPYATSLGAAGAGLLTGLSGAYDAALKQGLSAAGVNNIAYLDPRGLFAYIYARPAAYGITNTTIPACGASSSLGCGTAQQIPGSSTYMFADGVHPSAASQKIISDWVYATLEAPSRFSAMAALPIGRLDAQWRALDNRRLNNETADTPSGQGFFVTGDYAPGNWDATANLPALSGNGKSITVGVDRIWGTLVGGFAIGLSNNDFDLGGNAGKLKYNETILSAFGSSRMEDFYSDATLSYSSLDFDTTRNVALGPLTIANSGSTKASLWGFKLGGGYNLKRGNLVHGPVAALSWEKVKVDGFSESAGVTAMSFGDQSRESMRHRIGWQAVWQVQSDFAVLSPYLRLTHEKEYKDNQGSVSARMFDSPFTFSVPTTGQKAGYGMLAFGTQMKFRELTAHIGATTNFNQSGTRNSSITFGMGVPF